MLSRGCGSEDQEGKFSRTSRGTGTRKFFLTLTLAFTITPSLPYLLSCYLFHIFFCPSLPKLHSLHFHVHQGHQVLELDAPQFIQLKLKQHPKLTNDPQPQFLLMSTLFPSATMRWDRVTSYEHGLQGLNPWKAEGVDRIFNKGEVWSKDKISTILPQKCCSSTIYLSGL